MGLPHVKELPGLTRKRLSQGAIQVSLGLYGAWIGVAMSPFHLMIQDSPLGDQPWTKLTACGIVNTGTAVAVIGAILCLQTLERSWSYLLSALFCITSAAIVHEWLVDRLRQQPVFFFLFLFLALSLNACFAVLLLRGLRPFVTSEFDQELVRSTRELLAGMNRVLSRWPRAWRTPTRREIARLFRWLSVSILCLLAFDACVLGVLALIDCLIYPTFFGVIPISHLLGRVTLAPFMLLAGMLFAVSVGVLVTGGILVVCFSSILVCELLSQIRRLRRDIAWADLEPIDLPAAFF
jgi:hypothetical protein